VRNPVVAKPPVDHVSVLWKGVVVNDMASDGQMANSLGYVIDRWNLVKMVSISN
jgi:hypothetical protein